jgi:hypothetical protein
LNDDTGTRQRIGNASAHLIAAREAGAVDVPDARRLVGLLAEPDRRRVAAAMILGEVTLDGIARAARLDRRAVVDALDRLVAGGLVEPGEPGVFVLLEETFKRAARTAAPPTGTAHPDAPTDERRVLDTSFRDGRLVQLPARRSRRLIVLNRLAQRFEPGRRYRERDVNAVLRDVHDDTAALRRYLVDEGFLDRSGGEYWRSGGTVA